MKMKMLGEPEGAYTFENEMRDVFLLFNKVSGAYVMQVSAAADDQVSTLGSAIKLDNFDVKRVKMVPETQTWEGTFAAGKIVDLVSLKKPVDEVILNARTKDTIHEAYTNHKQINIIVQAVKAIAESLALDDDRIDALVAMDSHIKAAVAANNAAKEEAKADDAVAYLDKKELRAKEADVFAGELRNLILESSVLSE